MNHQSETPDPRTNPNSGLNQRPGQNKLQLSMDPKVKLLLLLVLVLVLAVVLALIFHKSNKTTTTGQAATPALPTAQVTIAADGFSPQTLSVKAGTIVTFKNTDTSTTHQIASDPYPKDNSLSALKSTQLGQNTNYSYKFTTKGTINYHDDLHPTLSGTVVVE